MNISAMAEDITLFDGQRLDHATAVVILIHGRGGTAADMLSLSKELYHPQVAYVAPQANNMTWYPNSFLAPRSANQPWLSNSLSRISALVSQIVAENVALNRIVLAGFSQGACLACEYIATHPHRYGGLIAFTGGLIGPPGSDLSHEGDLSGTPVFLGSGDPDPHVPWARVEETAAILADMGADVTMRKYVGRAHTVSHAELVAANVLIQSAFG